MRNSLERQLAALEARYSEHLIAALQRCAAGRWGLFGHNDAASSKLNAKLQERLADAAVGELLDTGRSIEEMRRKLGIPEPFALHDRLLIMRASHSANTAGEPKLAQKWLDELQA